MPLEVDGEESFERDVLGCDVPVIVDFWAAWCAPCRLVAPELEALANEMQGKIKIAKVNIDANPSIASKYGIQSIPTIMLFKDGEPAGITIGAKPRSMIAAELGLDGL